MIGIDTNIEVIVVSSTTWEAHHSPRAKPEDCGELPRARFLSSILSQVTWQVTWPRPRSQVTCGVFCFCFLKWLHKSLGPKSLGLFWNAPYCSPSDALLTSPCISVNTIVTSRVNTIVTSLNAAPSQPTMPTMLSQPIASHR